MKNITISTVTPVYSGEDYIGLLVDKLKEVKDSFNNSDIPINLIESIFVVDAAIDDSLAVLKRLVEKHKWIRVVTLSKNYGQHPATEAGILYSSGDWVVTLDEDLQHDPVNIKEMLIQAMSNSDDIVYASPIHFVHESKYRDITARVYKYFISKIMSDTNVRDYNSFRVVRGEIARSAAAVCGHDMYFDVALEWFSNKISTCDIDLLDERYKNTKQSGYTFYKLLSHARRLFVSAQSKVLRLFALVGVISMFIGFMFGSVIIFLKLLSYFVDGFSWDSSGWTSLMAAILFSGGIISLAVGVLLEYMSVIFLQIQGKPTFFVVDRSKDEILQKWQFSEIGINENNSLSG